MVVSLQCSKIGCIELVFYDQPLCEIHWHEFRESRLSMCERCHQYDYMSLALEPVIEDAPLCAECRQEVQTGQYQYIYILTLDGGDCYLGQTDDLERQVKEHYDRKIPSTAGRNPQLVWSEQWVGHSIKLRERKDDLAKLYSENPRAMLYKLQARLPLGGIQWG
jgi:predicted GIY-YIG superfamily endonuclease